MIVIWCSSCLLNVVGGAEFRILFLQLFANVEQVFNPDLGMLIHIQPVEVGLREEVIEGVQQNAWMYSDPHSFGPWHASPIMVNNMKRLWTIIFVLLIVLVVWWRSFPFRHQLCPTLIVIHIVLSPWPCRYGFESRLDSRDIKSLTSPLFVMIFITTFFFFIGHRTTCRL